MERGSPGMIVKYLPGLDFLRVLPFLVLEIDVEETRAYR